MQPALVAGEIAALKPEHKITSRGQITIPAEIRKKLGVKEGDKVVFLEENGRVIIENSTMIALRNVQEAFRGEAELTVAVGTPDPVDRIAQVLPGEVDVG